jgi:hypothetical protein
MKFNVFLFAELSMRILFASSGVTGMVLGSGDMGRIWNLDLAYQDTTVFGIAE